MNNLNENRGPMMMELPEDERPREKLLNHGTAFLSNTELLAILMGTGTREESVMTLASRVIASAGGLPGLASLSPQEMKTIKGVGTAKACSLAAALELGRRMAGQGCRERIKFGCPEDAAALFMEDMRHLRQENFRCALLNIKNEVMSVEQVSVGCVNATHASPRDVFEGAIRKGAASVIIAHNHPSGDPEPSEEDKNLTRRLCESGEILGIKVLDHIIIGDGIFISMLREGFIS
ncbi:MAG: DNA repair protein RadC [Clostridia bacterium]|nr:DNA repair protein RadC [Clostridia bacterium]